MNIHKSNDTISIYCKEETGIAVLDASNISEYADIYNLRGNVWYFNRINVPKQLRNSGLATKMMKELVTIMKQEKIIMICDVNPYGDLNEKQLKRFYEKFGFKNSNQGYMLFNNENRL